MNLPPKDVRQLLAEVALVAVNHGFFREARVILAALPDLIDDPSTRQILEAAILIGLGEQNAAAKLLEGTQSAEADMLRGLVSGPEAGPCSPSGADVPANVYPALTGPTLARDATWKSRQPGYLPPKVDPKSFPQP
jgi:type III secretion system SsaH family protein